MLILTIGGITLARYSSELIPENTLEKAVIILKAVAHHDRLQIVNILMKRESCVGELKKLLDKTQFHTSDQLSTLKLAGVLKSRKNGLKVYYSSANNGIKRIVKSIITEI